MRGCGVSIPASDNAEAAQTQRTEYGVELAIGLASEDAVRSGTAACSGQRTPTEKLGVRCHY